MLRFRYPYLRRTPREDNIVWATHRVEVRGAIGRLPLPVARLNPKQKLAEAPRYD